MLIFKEGGKPEKNNPLSISLHMVPLPVVNSHPPWDGSLVCSHPLSIEYRLIPTNTMYSTLQIFPYVQIKPVL